MTKGISNRMITPPDIFAGKKDNIALIKPLVGKINIPKINNMNKIIINGIANEIILPKFIV